MFCKALCLVSVLIACTAAGHIHISSGTMTWQEATKYCKERHQMLAYPRTHQDFRANFAHIHDHVWLGIRRYAPKENGFAATDFQSHYLPWRRSEPNNYHGHENCVHLIHRRLNDNDCMTKYKAACR